MERQTLVADRRDHTGSGHNTRLRQNMRVPAVLYSSHMDGNALLSLSERDVNVFLNNNDAGTALYLQIDGKDHFVLLKDIQYHPTSRKVLHMDFQQLKSDEEIKVSIPIYIQGVDELRDFVCQSLLSELEISCLPQYLVDNITLDVKGSVAGDQFLVSDLDIYNDENISVLTEPDSIIYLISDAQVFEEPEAGEDAEGEEAPEAVEDQEETAEEEEQEE